MIRAAVWAASTFCCGLGAALFTAAWRRSRSVRALLRAPMLSDETSREGTIAVRGVVEPGGELFTAPLSQRPSLYVHTAVEGPPADGGPARVLWDRTYDAPAVLQSPDGRVRTTIALKDALVLVPRDYRQGALRALLVDARVLANVLSRAGYKKAPPAGQFFRLEEESLLPGTEVHVMGRRDADGTFRTQPDAPLVVVGLTRGRMLLRLAWGPLLAALLAVLCIGTGVTLLLGERFLSD